MQFDDIITQVGDFGLYQRRLLLLVLFPQILIACHSLLPAFILSNHKHCEAEKNIYFHTSHDLSVDGWKLRCKYENVDAIPDGVISYGYSNGSYMSVGMNTTKWRTSCIIHSYDNITNATSSTSCSSWDYDTTEFQATPISDFDLVCDDQLLKSHASMAFMGGNVVGCLILGAVGDTFGRKPVMYFGAVCLLGSSLACAWSSSFIMFAVLRFICGTATISCITPSVIIVFELVGPSRRSFITIIVEFAWCVGEIILCGLAYFIRDWRQLMLAISAPGVLLLSYWLFMPESPRWLLSRGRSKEASNILNKLSRANDTVCSYELSDVSNEQNSEGEVAPLFKSPTLLIRWLIIVCIWFVISMAYYGLSLNVGDIAGNIYVNFLISAVVEAIGYALCLYINTKFGRKPLNCGSLLLGGVACLSTIFTSLFIPKQSSSNWLTTALSMIGKMGVSASFANMFIFTSELFPTTIRSFTIASSSVVGRIGSTVSPYVADLGDLVKTDFGKTLPLIVFGACTTFAGILSFALPETLNKYLPQTIQDLTTTKKKQREVDL